MTVPENTLTEFLRRSLLQPTASLPVGVLRVLMAVMVAWTFWSTGGEGIEPPNSARLIGWYEAVFLTPWYWGLVLLGLLVFGAGVRPRLVGPVLVGMLLPLTILSRGQQSRQVLLLAFASFTLLRSGEAFAARDLWRRLTRPSGVRRREGVAATSPGRRSSPGPIWPIRLIQLQLTIVYGVNALAKTSEGYLSGDVLVGMSIMRPNIHVDLTDGFLHVGALAIPVVLAAVGSVLVEYFLALAFWFRKTRYVAAVVGICFHAALSWFMSIFMLDWVTMFLYLAFLLPLAGAEDQANGAAGRREPRRAAESSVPVRPG